MCNFYIILCIFWLSWQKIKYLSKHGWWRLVSPSVTLLQSASWVGQDCEGEAAHPTVSLIIKNKAFIEHGDKAINSLSWSLVTWHDGPSKHIFLAGVDMTVRLSCLLTPAWRPHLASRLAATTTPLLLHTYCHLQSKQITTTPEIHTIVCENYSFV